VAKRKKMAADGTIAPPFKKTSSIFPANPKGKTSLHYLG